MLWALTWLELLLLQCAPQLLPDPGGMLATKSSTAFRPFISLRLCKPTLSSIRALQSMATSAGMAVAFKSSSAEQEFARIFQLVDGSDVKITIIGQSPASSTAPSGSSSSSSSFKASTFFQHLTATNMGHTLMTTPSIPSTQEFMRAHSTVLPDGAVLVADQQTRGKGRGGNVWTSPSGCLMFTALRRLQVPGAQAPFINYVVCLAVVLGIKEATKHLVQGGLDVQIKWPNDIYYAGMKIGGALIHTTWSTNRFCVLTGIGLNVSNSQPTTCLDDIIAHQHRQQQQQHSEAQGGRTGPKLCPEQLLASVISHLESCFKNFESQGFAALKPLYLASWMHTNQQVELAADVEASGTGVGVVDRQQQVTLTIVGLSPHGFLLAVDALGQEYELTPDGNSLDMMQGLIKKKLS